MYKLLNIKFHNINYIEDYCADKVTNLKVVQLTNTDLIKLQSGPLLVKI